MIPATALWVSLAGLGSGCLPCSLSSYCSGTMLFKVNGMVLFVHCTSNPNLLNVNSLDSSDIRTGKLIHLKKMLMRTEKLIN